MPIPYVTMDYPKKMDRYNEFESDGIKVFIQKGVKIKNNSITITLSGFFIFKSLEVHGLDWA